MRALEEWRQVARAHILGVLHLDEIQNLFKLNQRLTRNGSIVCSFAQKLNEGVVSITLHRFEKFNFLTSLWNFDHNLMSSDRSEPSCERFKIGWLLINVNC